MVRLQNLMACPQWLDPTSEVTPLKGPTTSQNSATGSEPGFKHMSLGGESTYTTSKAPEHVHLPS